MQCGRPGFDPWIGKILWRREWHPTPVLLPGESHGQRTLAGYSPWGFKESHTTERLALLLLNLPKWSFETEGEEDVPQSLSRVRLYKPMDRSLAGSSAHGIFPARILEWIVISSSRGCVQFIIKACIYFSNNFSSVVVIVFSPCLNHFFPTISSPLSLIKHDVCSSY